MNYFNYQFPSCGVGETVGRWFVVVGELFAVAGILAPHVNTMARMLVGAVSIGRCHVEVAVRRSALWALTRVFSSIPPDQLAQIFSAAEISNLLEWLAVLLAAEHVRIASSLLPL